VDWFVKRFLQSALVWLGLGVSAGVAMAVHPQWIIYRPAHEHMNLLGFVTMMIFGVGYHVVPRFFGHPFDGPGALTRVAQVQQARRLPLQ
jgi:hypothetical protein